MCFWLFTECSIKLFEAWEMCVNRGLLKSKNDAFVGPLYSYKYGFNVISRKRQNMLGNSMFHLIQYEF